MKATSAFGVWGYRIALVGLTLLAIGSLLPLYWMVTGSLKLQQNAMSVPPELFPAHPTFENYVRLFTGNRPVLRSFLNSLITAGSISIGAVLTSAGAGYAFGLREFPGKRWLFAMILVSMILPKEVSVVPLLVMMRKLGWVDTYAGLIAPFLAYPFGIFLVRQYVQSLPRELLDAAEMDGAGELQVFTRIILPLTRPATGAVAIFAFMAGWNEFLWQLLIIQAREEMLTLPVMISRLVSSLTSYDLGVAMAGATFAFLPMLVVFLAFQSYFVRGVTLGAVKG